MEDGDTDGDNHSDRDSDKLGNGIVYAMRKKGAGARICARPSFLVAAGNDDARL